ncbi:hypothetical protein [Microbacterium sp.]|uniref:hypothetical protein n=1 Tax=Microbacterium sp. TaxID=51671 RepID=UPI00289C682D|nr:hypothetical protein [Microbacterium sp.]
MSARRLLREKFALGLFENPYVDEAAAASIVGAPEHRAAGLDAQRASIAVLSNDGALPFARGAKLYVEGIDAEVAAAYGRVVATPAEADLALLRIAAPYEQRSSMFENFFHAGSLEFPDETLAHIREIAASVPTVVDVFLDWPAILGPIVEVAASVTGNWGAHPTALLDVLSGAARARGSCRSTSRARWPPSRRRAPTCRSTPPTRCSGSATASRCSGHRGMMSRKQAGSTPAGR